MLKMASINEYAKMTGVSRPMVEKMISDGILQHTKTVGGGKTLVIYEANEEIEKLKTEVASMHNLLKCLCKHLGLKDEQ